MKERDLRLRGDDERIISAAFYDAIFSSHVKENEETISDKHPGVVEILRVLHRGWLKENLRLSG